MKRTGLLVLSLLAVSWTAAGEDDSKRPKDPAEKGLEPLFNGKDLTGWVWRGNREEAENPFSMKDGVLHCKGRPAGYLHTEKKYTSFIFELEWRWPEGSRPGNNGILVRVLDGKHFFGNTWPKSIEVQLANQGAGDIFTIGQFPLTTGRNRGRYTKKMKESNEKPQGEWNHCRVVLDGEKLSITVNGELQNEGTGAEIVPGSIGLQSEGAPIEYRNVRLKSMEAAPPGEKSKKPAE